MLSNGRRWTLLALALLILFLGYSLGCAGVAVIVRGSHDYRLERPVLVGSDALSSQHRGKPSLASEFRRAFGEPDEIVERGSEKERWRYAAGVRLHGAALLLVVVPIPLLIPTGFHEAWVEIEHGEVIRVTGSHNGDLLRLGCMIGPLAAFSGDSGCFAEGGKAPPAARVGSGELWLGPAPSLQPAPGTGVSKRLRRVAR